MLMQRRVKLKCKGLVYMHEENTVNKIEVNMIRNSKYVDVNNVIDKQDTVNGLAKDCGNSIANTLEFKQSSTKSLK